MKVIYEILNVGTQGGSKLSGFYFPVTIALSTYVRRKQSILIDDSRSSSGPMGIILEMIGHFGRNLET